MSAREWKPGDVAALGSSFALRTRKGWAYPDGSVGGIHQDSYSLRPLVVIDPEDREQLSRLLDAVSRHGMTPTALLSLITPPKPDEPTGLGAVVEDSEGRVFVRVSAEPVVDPWISSGGAYVGWHHIEAVKVLSEGVQP